VCDWLVSFSSFGMQDRRWCEIDPTIMFFLVGGPLYQIVWFWEEALSFCNKGNKNRRSKLTQVLPVLLSTGYPAAITSR
jgi:hypothetical protein